MNVDLFLSLTETSAMAIYSHMLTLQIFLGFLNSLEKRRFFGGKVCLLLSVKKVNLNVETSSTKSLDSLMIVISRENSNQEKMKEARVSKR
jgi:hypothetical protein